MSEQILQINKDVRERFLKLERRVRKNEVISGFYESRWQDIVDDYVYFYGSCTEDEQTFIRLQDKYANHVFKSINAVKCCAQFYDVDYYRFQSVKDIKRTSSCNNKFCDACQSKISQQRYEKFKPVLEELRKNFDIAHVVLTVPNCNPEELESVVLNMLTQFKFFIRYLDGRKKIRGIDFGKYGFCGAVRSMEVSRNDSDGKFHPHFHCVMIFKKKSGVFAHGKFLNSYSFDNMKGREPRSFNAFEILLQKIWRLRIDGVKVTKENIAALKEGYSVYCERRADFKEVFKYATKGVIKWNEDVSQVLGSCYEFLTMDRALYGRRLIQSYGILRGIPMPEEVDQSAEGDQEYEKIIQTLRFLETPIQQKEYLSSLLEDIKGSEGMKYISRHNIRAFLGGDDEK